MNDLNLHDSPFTGRSLIEASAGTGKTWTLTALYARLLLERELAVGQILVVTYTTAAIPAKRHGGACCWPYMASTRRRSSPSTASASAPCRTRPSRPAATSTPS